MSGKPSHFVTEHGQWRSAFTFVMATTGAAVGLGNIWKFPHMAGDNGGSAFVLVYLICVLTIGVPAMIAEVMIGRLGRKNPVDSLHELAIVFKASPSWRIFGWLGALALLSVLSFYSVVAGWSVAYVVMAIEGVFNNITPDQVSQTWDDLMGSPGRLLLWHSVFMVMTLGVVARGVEKGIEVASNILMPFLFIILILLVLYAGYVGDLKAAWNFLFSFNVNEITPSVMISAMGHAFFTLALGAGALLVYGAYLPSTTSIGKTLSIVALLDTIVALLAGLAIFPIVFQYNLEPSEGFGLMYKILPISFSGLPYGQFVACAFFLLLVFAAWTSTFSLAEPLVMLSMEKFKLSRGRAAIYVGSLAWVLGIGGLLSFNVLQGENIIQYFDLTDVDFIKDWDFFTILTTLPTNLLLPIGALAFALFAGYVIDKKTSREVLGLGTNIHRVWLGLVRYVVPVGIMTIFLANLL